MTDQVQTDVTNRSILVSFTLDQESVGKLSVMASETGQKKSAIVRDAIDMLYHAHSDARR